LGLKIPPSAAILVLINSKGLVTKAARPPAMAPIAAFSL